MDGWRWFKISYRWSAQDSRVGECWTLSWAEGKQMRFIGSVQTHLSDFLSFWRLWSFPSPFIFPPGCWCIPSSCFQVLLFVVAIFFSCFPVLIPSRLHWGAVLWAGATPSPAASLCTFRRVWNIIGHLHPSSTKNSSPCLHRRMEEEEQCSQSITVAPCKTVKLFHYSCLIALLLHSTEIQSILCTWKQNGNSSAFWLLRELVSTHCQSRFVKPDLLPWIWEPPG